MLLLLLVGIVVIVVAFGSNADAVEKYRDLSLRVCGVGGL